MWRAGAHLPLMSRATLFRPGIRAQPQLRAQRQGQQLAAVEGWRGSGLGSERRILVGRAVLGAPDLLWRERWGWPAVSVEPETPSHTVRCSPLSHLSLVGASQRPRSCVRRKARLRCGLLQGWVKVLTEVCVCAPNATLFAYRLRPPSSLLKFAEKPTRVWNHPQRDRAVISLPSKSQLFSVSFLLSDDFKFSDF